MAQALTIRNDQLAQSASIGLASLSDATWPTPGVDEFLALLALRIVLAGHLVGTVERQSDPTGRTKIRVKFDGKKVPEERIRAANLLVAPLGVYADLAGISYEYSANDTGALPIPLLIMGGVVSVSLVAGGAYVVTYVAKEAATVVDNALRRNAASKAVQEADAQVLQVMNAHVQREVVAGKIIEFDSVERSILDALQNRISNIVKQAYATPDGKLPSWVVPTVGVLGAAAVAGALYLFGKGNN